MKIYKSNAIRYTLSLSLIIAIGLYFLINISDKSTDKINVLKNSQKSLEWFIEDFTLTNYDKTGALSHKLVANNAYKYLENNFIKLESPFLTHFPTREYNNIYNVSANSAFIFNKSNAIKSKKSVANTDVDSIEFNGKVLIKTPEIIAKSQALRYNLENQSMQLSKNVETTYIKKS